MPSIAARRKYSDRSERFGTPATAGRLAPSARCTPADDRSSDSRSGVRPCAAAYPRFTAVAAVFASAIAASRVTRIRS
jgi:hypothetical protein